jgi:hypothetical protein
MILSSKESLDDGTKLNKTFLTLLEMCGCAF